MVSATDDLDDHHIFPKDYLKKALKDSEDDTEGMVNCVINRCLIPKFTNLKASNKAPSVYLAQLSERNGKLVEALRGHLVPADIVDGVYDELYPLFLEDRGANIMTILRRHVFDEREKMLTAGQFPTS